MYDCRLRRSLSGTIWCSLQSATRVAAEMQNAVGAYLINSGGVPSRPGALPSFVSAAQIFAIGMRADTLSARSSGDKGGLVN